jgi:hypothetical protein
MSTRPQRTFPSEPTQADENDKTVIRVRRGALRRFDQLKTKSAHLPVDVKWDRRTAERRTTPEAAGEDRRTGDRREQPPFTWDAADFVVEGDHSRAASGPESTPPRRRK